MTDDDDGPDTLRNWIEEEAAGEAVEAVMIGRLIAEGWRIPDDDIPGYKDHPRDRLLTWAEAVPFLEYTFDSGFGAAGCEAVYAWTASKVIFVSTYDGSTQIQSIPRHPTVCVPEMPGGG